MNDDPKLKASRGDARSAWAVARRAAKTVPGYRRFLEERGVDPAVLLSGGVLWTDIPVMDKKNFLLAYPLADLLAPGDSAFTFMRSSGTGGPPHFWPRRAAPRPLWERLIRKARTPRLDLSDTSGILDHLFRIRSVKTLAIVGQALGPWASGLLTHSELYNLAHKTPSLTVLCVGSRYDEIIDTVLTLHAPYERVLLLMVPSGIEALLELVDQRGAAFPFEKSRFAVLAEPFTEEFRQRLSESCRPVFPETAIAAYSYGLSEMGRVGCESMYSAALRRLLHLCPPLREALRIESPLPGLFHLSDSVYAETIGGELVCTQWDHNAIPLVRYNVHDDAEIWDWSWLRRWAARAAVPPEAEPLRRLVAQSPRLPDIVAYYGRNNGIKILGGVLLHDADLDAALHSPELLRWATGQHMVRPAEGRRDGVHWDIELKRGADASPELEELFYKVLVREMRSIDAQFSNDYQNIYRLREDDPEKRVFRIRFHPWPSISEKLRDQPKRRLSGWTGPPPQV